MIGKTLAISPKALYEQADPSRMLFMAFGSLVQNIAATDKMLRATGVAIDVSTLALTFRLANRDNGLTDGEPGTEDNNALLSWEAETITLGNDE